MNIYVRKLKFVIFYKYFGKYKLYLALSYDPEISKKSSLGKSDSHLTGLLCCIPHMGVARMNPCYTNVFKYSLDYYKIVKYNIYV